ncbi:MAG: protein kinase [bacterium]|nr:protein kinase [bacterium]
MNEGSRVGNYQLLNLIAQGGMAEVWRAKKLGVSGFEKIVAIKFIREEILSNEDFVNMFINEAKLSAQLSHQNIIQIFELDKYKNNFYIVMEYLFGKNLKELLTKFKFVARYFPIELAVYIIRGIALALEYAHRKNDQFGNPLNLVHLDISPHNILVSFEGEIKLTDFGIAKAASLLSTGQDNVLKGKFSYMSPEQTFGKDIDSSSDLFSLGIVFYELVTGEKLFTGTSSDEILKKVQTMEIKMPSNIRTDLSPDIDGIILKMLERHKNFRYKNASELRSALDTYIIKAKIENSESDLRKLMQSIFVNDVSSSIAERIQVFAEEKRDHQTTFERSVTQYHRILSENPEDYETLTKLGTVLIQAKRHNEAIEQLKKAIEVKPDYLPAYLKLAQAFLELDKTSLLKQVFNKIMEINPNYKDIDLIKAQFLFKHGNLSEAKRLLSDLLAEKPNLIDGYLCLGNILQQENDIKGALEAYQKVTKLEPEFIELNKQISQMLDDLFQKELDIGYDIKTVEKPVAGKEIARIIIVDDDKFILKLMKIILEDSGYKVFTASDAIVAKDILSKENIDLIILDIVLPKLNGFDFAKELKKTPGLNTIPILFISGVYRKSQYVSYGFNLGAVDFLFKPIEKKPFLDKVNTIINNVKVPK